MRDIVKAYNFLYKNKILHRDLKLANILVGEGFQVKLADFGFAKVQNGEEFYNQSVGVGTPLTSSPEILCK